MVLRNSSHRQKELHVACNRRCPALKQQPKDCVSMISKTFPTAPVVGVLSRDNFEKK